MKAKPARAAIGLPPNVQACMPGRRLLAISAVVNMAPPARPPQTAFDSVITSGVTLEPLVGEPVAGPSAAGLHLVENQQQLVLVGQLAQAGQETVGRNADAAFALDRLDHDGGRLVVDQPRHGLQVAKGGVDEAGHQRPEPLVVLRLGRGRGGAQRPAVEAALERDDLVALLGRVQPGELDRRLVGLGARVAEERLAAETPLARGPGPSGLAAPCARCWARGSSWPNCSRTASTTVGGQCPSRLQPQPLNRSR